MTTYRKCKVCNGKGVMTRPYGPRGQSGYDSDEEFTCGNCRGEGQVEVQGEAKREAKSA